MSNSFWARSYGPMPKEVLFWSGKLMRSAIGFCAAFASAAVLASSDSASAGATAAGLPCATATIPDRRARQNKEQSLLRRPDSSMSDVLSTRFHSLRLFNEQNALIYLALHHDCG